MGNKAECNCIEPCIHCGSDICPCEVVESITISEEELCQIKEALRQKLN